MRVLDWFLGRPLQTEEAEHQQIGSLAGVPMLRLDALSSAACGPEVALTLLTNPLGDDRPVLHRPHHRPDLRYPADRILLLPADIHSYPGGGGSYTVASENLGQGPALLDGAALALDC